MDRDGGEAGHASGKAHRGCGEAGYASGKAHRGCGEAGYAGGEADRVGAEAGHASGKAHRGCGEAGYAGGEADRVGAEAGYAGGEAHRGCGEAALRLDVVIVVQGLDTARWGELDVGLCNLARFAIMDYNLLNREVKMKTLLNRRIVLTILPSIVILGLLSAPVYGQWVKVPTGGIPRGPNGKPNLSAPAPRSADGHPDLSGVWESGGAKYILDIASDLKPGDVPFQPWAKALVDQRADGSHSGEDPPANCLPRGVPRINASPPPWRVIQRSDVIGILYESDNAWRQIFLDGRELGNDAPPAYLGYSTGKWQGDILVVDTRGFNGKTWLDQTGKPTSEALHVTERFRRTDFGHMEIVITIDDPKVYTKPWTVTEHVRLMTDGDIIESPCENNRDLQHLGGQFSSK